MPNWITKVRGLTTLLDALGNPLPRRKMLQVIGATATDDGTKNILTIPPGPTGATGPMPSTASLRGVGLTVVGATLEPRPRLRRVWFQEQFLGGGETDRTIGMYGWRMTGVGTPSAARQSFSLQSNNGRIIFSTSAANNDRTSVYLADQESENIIALSEIDRLQAIIRLGSTATNRFFFGMINDFSLAPASATNCLGFLYDSSLGANWRTLSRVAGVGSPVDSGIAAVTTQTLLSIVQTTANTYQLRIGETIANTFSGVADSTQNLGMTISTLTTATASFRCGGILFSSALLQGALDDDNFLEV